MISQKKTNRSIILHVILCLIITVLIIFTVASDATFKPPTSDDLHYIVMGYNIQKYGTFSMEDSDTPDPAPTAYRDPGFPAYLALSMKIHPILNSMSLEELLDNGLKMLRYLQIPLIIFCAFLAMYISYLFTKSWLLAYLALILTGFSEVMGIIANHLLSENLAALFILLCSLFLYKIYETKKIAYFIALGISLAVLTLIKAIFMYFIIILLIIFIVLIFKYAWKNKKRFITGIVLFAVIYSAIIGGWMFRNYTHFNQWTITNKGGIVLYYRSKLNTMTTKEYLASFIYWLPGKGVKEGILDRFFDEEDYNRLDKSMENEGYRKFARDDLQDLIDSYIKQGYKEQDAILLADKDLQNLAIKNIIRQPLKHVLVTIPIAWSGIWVETAYKLMFINQNILFIELRSALFIPLILFACFIASIVWTIIKKKWGILLFYAPALYLYLINSFITHNKPRYNYPLIPILNISVILIIFFIISKIEEKRALKADKES